MHRSHEWGHCAIWNLPSLDTTTFQGSTVVSANLGLSGLLNTKERTRFAATADTLHSAPRMRCPRQARLAMYRLMVHSTVRQKYKGTSRCNGRRKDKAGRVQAKKKKKRSYLALRRTTCMAGSMTFYLANQETRCCVDAARVRFHGEILFVQLPGLGKA